MTAPCASRPPAVPARATQTGEETQRRNALSQGLLLRPSAAVLFALWIGGACASPRGVAPSQAEADRVAPSTGAPSASLALSDALARLCAEQREDGGWALEPGGPVDAEATALAILALTLDRAPERQAPNKAPVVAAVKALVGRIDAEGRVQTDAGPLNPARQALVSLALVRSWEKSRSFLLKPFVLKALHRCWADFGLERGDERAPLSAAAEDPEALEWLCACLAAVVECSIEPPRNALARALEHARARRIEPTAALELLLRRAAGADAEQLSAERARLAQLCADAEPGRGIQQLRHAWLALAALERAPSVDTDQLGAWREYVAVQAYDAELTSTQRALLAMLLQRLLPEH